MHEAEVGARLRHHAGELRIGAERRDVVDELCAELERASRHVRLGRVDRDRQLSRDRLEHRHDTPELLVERDARRAGAGRLAADVQQVGAVVHQPQGVSDGDGRIKVAAAVGEAVRGDVDDPEDERAAELEPAVAAVPDERCHDAVIIRPWTAVTRGIKSLVEISSAS